MEDREEDLCKIYLRILFFLTTSNTLTSLINIRATGKTIKINMLDLKTDLNRLYLPDYQSFSLYEEPL